LFHFGFWMSDPSAVRAMLCSYFQIDESIPDGIIRGVERIRPFFRRAKQLAELAHHTSTSLDRDAILLTQVSDLYRGGQALPDMLLGAYPPAPSVKTYIKHSISIDPCRVRFTIRLRYALPVGPAVFSVRFNGTGSHFAFTACRSLYVFATKDGSPVHAIELPLFAQTDELPARSLCFSPETRTNGQYLAVSGPGHNLTVIELATSGVRQLAGHEGFVMSIIFLSDGSKMLSGGRDGKLCIWSVPDFDLVNTIDHRSAESKGGHGVIMGLTQCPDGHIAVGFLDGKVGIYDAAFSRPILDFEAHDEPLLNIVSAPSGAIATSSCDKTAKLWCLMGAACCTSEMRGHTDAVVAIAMTPRDSIVFTGSKDETIRAWSTKNGDRLFALYAHKNTVLISTCIRPNA
jgi:WD40 repeat protein